MIFFRSSISSICGHSSMAVKDFYLLEDRKADVQNVEDFNTIVGSNYTSCDSDTSPSIIQSMSCQSPSYASMDPAKKTRFFYNNNMFFSF